MINKKHYSGHRKRLRERMAKDPRLVADYEVLELILGYVLIRKDTKPLAKELLYHFKTLRGVFYAPKPMLKKITGFGPSLENFWILWHELHARLAESPLKSKPKISDVSQIAEMAMARLGSSTIEEFWVALVDNKMAVMAWERISIGTVDRAPVYPREVINFALSYGASGLFLVHNHTSYDPKPSRADEELTLALLEVAQKMSLRIVDHIIVTKKNYYSFASGGYIPDYF